MKTTLCVIFMLLTLITLCFMSNSFAQNTSPEYVVRVIYFFPNDREPQPDIDLLLNPFMKEMQQLFADAMEAHGFGRKTFRLETDANGNSIVNHVKGKFNDAHYSKDTYGSFKSEIVSQFDMSKNIYLFFVDIRSMDALEPCGVGAGDSDSGVAYVPAFGRSGCTEPDLQNTLDLAVHELKHAFGDLHEHPSSPPYQLSICEAEWLDRHRYFNRSQENVVNHNTSIKMLPPTLVSSPATIRLRFEIADPDGLHQAQLFRAPYAEVIACKKLSGKSVTIDFVTTQLSDVNTIHLQVMDAHGNFTWLGQSFPIDVSSLLSSGETISIPDPNLAAAIREDLGLTSGDTITQLDMLKLRYFTANRRQITNLTGLEHAIHVATFSLTHNQIHDITPLLKLTNLRSLIIDDNQIRDIAPFKVLTHLIVLTLSNNQISDITDLSSLIRLEVLNLGDNPISDIRPIAELLRLRRLDLYRAKVSDISPLTKLTGLLYLNLRSNQISNINSLAGLTNLKRLNLSHNSISDISPLVANTGLGRGDTVTVRGNPLSYQSIHTHIPTLEGRGVTVEFQNRTPRPPLKISGDNQQGVPGAALEQPFVVVVRDQKWQLFAEVPVVFTVTEGGGTLSITSTTTDANGRAQSTLTLGSEPGTNTVEVSVEGIAEVVTFTTLAEIEFNLSVAAGINLIHLPSKVTAVDGVAQTITLISDLYDALGGASKVNFLITYVSQTQEWQSYFGPLDTGTSADRTLTDDMGIIAGMIAPASVRLTGSPLGTDGSSAITLKPGLNLVGLPLRDSRINRVSDLFGLEGVGGNVPVIILTDDGEFQAVGRAGDPGDIPIVGGQSFIMTAQREATVTLSGDGWHNTSGTAAAPPIALTVIEVKDTTPVLALRGSIVDKVTGGINQMEIRVTVKNLSTNKEVATVKADEGTGYRLTVVDIETARAATIGDILEISAQSPHPFIGVEPLQYTVTAEDVKQSLIQLPELVVYKIPAETELLRNYPNPFNPETWIPYRLAADAFVTLIIYDASGGVVRSIDVGYKPAAVYESKAKAIYWDGRNEFGEQVASGMYFYHLSTSRSGFSVPHRRDFSATRKMLILK